MRHGQTDYNAQGIVQGKGVDISINETGKQQANAFYRNFKNENFNVVFTSTLRRTIESVSSFIRDEIPHRQCSDIDEISWGEFEGRKSNSELRQHYRELINCWQAGELHKKISGGESPIELQNRVLKFVELIKETPFEKALICSHGRTIRCLVCTLLGQDLRFMSDYPHENLSLYKFEIVPNGVKLLLANDVEHLKDLNPVW